MVHVNTSLALECRRLLNDQAKQEPRTSEDQTKFAGLSAGNGGTNVYDLPAPTNLAELLQLSSSAQIKT